MVEPSEPKPGSVSRYIDKDRANRLYRLFAENKAFSEQLQRLKDSHIDVVGYSALFAIIMYSTLNEDKLPAEKQPRLDEFETELWGLITQIETEK